MAKNKQYIARPKYKDLPQIDLHKDALGLSAIKLSNLLQEYADCLDRTSGVEDYLTDEDFRVLDKAAYILRHFSGRFPK